MESQQSFDLLIIGSGPAGEVGAIRAAQLGLKVAVVEVREHLGGTCLNVGCIPTKVLTESARMWDKLNHAHELGFDVGTPAFSWEKIMARKLSIVDAQRKGLRFLMKKNKIEVIRGRGRLTERGRVTVTDDEGRETAFGYKNCLLATGSRVRELSCAPANGRNILTSDTILDIDHIPASLAVIGGGVVGMEFASLFGRFGSQVTVIESMDQVLPAEDSDSVRELLRALRKQHVRVESSSRVLSVSDEGSFCRVRVEGKEDRSFETVLVAIGRQPVTEHLGLRELGIRTDKHGFIEVDQHYRTSAPDIFAVGDIIATPALAHTASAEAKHAVEVISGGSPVPINYESNPSAVYTYPEIASIGLTEEALKAKEIPYKTARFPFAPLAKAKIENVPEGFVKILYDPQYHELLGVHIVGAKATELISEFVLGKILETTIDEIGLAIHPHPTLSETIMEAAHIAEGGPIHI
ncbi:MAG: dihydrolipoyl dehydrogenase [Deltaproteobacteria bacterium]|nr:dihydrolipoyl dehydrogenase [Deltaproteobacteria bacterium]